MTSEIENIIVKYISNSATSKDLDILSDWIETPENRLLFKDYVSIHYAINYNMNNPETDKIIEQLLATIRKEKSLFYKLKTQSIYKYAAAVILLGMLTTVYFLKNNTTYSDSHNTESIIVNNTISTGTNKAILILEDGTDVLLENNSSYQTQNLVSNGKEITYNSLKDKNAGEIVYNYLVIPRGGEFFVQLSDGTKVWLNSDSKIKYPVQFIAGALRHVELLYGEAYFDVSSSKNHEGSAFKVLTKSQEIEVLGTEFNIKAYKNDDFIATTLVEGQVAINKDGFNAILEPGQQSVVTQNNQGITINTVDIANEIAWKNGFFSFDKASLNDMLETLSRWYDLEVVYENDSKRNLVFSGVLKRTSNVEELLINIEKTGRVVFEVENKTVVIK
ncbi:FecR family protein [Flavivirga rizhaonensis]|uniref:DUF4974 domain-containing protein n=1 Tax=Flavivirga rizhaonensis TaxID=2559571 RepID=A0A4S1DVD5_9FLAO|nr:FecR domain-containing protein [Flavivirga rizhaonensis]TGV01392.1 DUF4974 domain-containing protein [Flavivirga rizhaonensis]